MKSNPPVGTRTFEDVTVAFLVRHVGKIYLGLLALSLVVVALRPQG